MSVRPKEMHDKCLIGICRGVRGGGGFLRKESLLWYMYGCFLELHIISQSTSFLNNIHNFEE